MLRLAVAVVLLVSVAGAGHPATSRGDFDRAPYYDGKVPEALEHVVHLPVAFRAEPATLEPTPSRSTALAALLDSLNSEIGRLGRTRRVDSPTERGPDVHFGCRRGGMGQDGIPLGASEIDRHEPRRLAFELEEPAKAWRERVAAAAEDAQAILVVQLGFGDYWLRQKDWKGGKQVELGTGRTLPVAWLTSLDDPVQVLQLTAALVSSQGKVLRLGAEAILARRTGMLASVAEVQEVLTEEDLAALWSSAPGAVPPWRAALQSLVAQMLVPGKAPR